MLFLKQPQILPFICHKSVTTSQMNSNKVSNSKLKLDLCNCVKTEVIEPTAPPNSNTKGEQFSLGNPVDSRKHSNLIEKNSSAYNEILRGSVGKREIINRSR